MHALNIHGAGDVRLDLKDPPTAGERDVIVAVRACGVCGSDLGYIKRGGINRPEGGVTALGHEAAGEVIAVGAAVKGVSVGQRVVINPMETSTNIGSGGPEGAFSEQVRVGDARIGESLLPIPNDVPFDVAAMAEPLAVALHGVNRTRARPGDKVAVFGCGPIGLGMVLWLIDRGVTDVVAIDLAEARLERAKALGARAVINPATENLKARLSELHGTQQVLFLEKAATDIYIDAAGGPNIIPDVISMAKTHARLVITAVYAQPVPLPTTLMLMSEMSITSALGYPTEMPEVVGALPRLKNKVASLISHRYRLDEIMEALSIAGTPQSAKVMIEYEPA
jgi:threonine dehydrogenase-like Zn-dependent dehydrogenase